MAEKKVIDGYEVPTDTDFDNFVKDCDSAVGWTEAYKNETCRVWSKSSSNSAINIVKIEASFKCPPVVLYDALHDAVYRSVWDENMLEGKVVHMLDGSNEIGYYSAKSPMGVSNRDFLNLRSWRVKGNEYIIMNHSVTHKDCPEKKDFVRAQSLGTGFLIRGTDTGCQLTYLTQTDPKGWIPSWIVNTVTKNMAPMLIGRLQNCAMKYEEWKKTHYPNWKPWYGQGVPGKPE
eukprot:TRINITY_DN1994_c0_g2_i1.p1 TRINITY_DN1994_c0_g2~~TRINITY_DN1994_c0_g2_i1.p1  ORF type:complete len:232 (-),score=23.89 TRINITY_DN1994_c0_g2_i1:123-818(-)